MLRFFSVKNFQQFREELVFDFTQTQDYQLCQKWLYRSKSPHEVEYMVQDYTESLKIIRRIDCNQIRFFVESY